MAKNTFEFKCIDDLDQFASKKEVWDEFMNKNFPTAYYLDHDWLSEWWRCYAKEETVFIFFVYMDSLLLGFLPLVLRRGKLSGFPVRVLEFLGNGFGPEDFPILTNKDRILKQLLTELDINVKWDILNLKRMSPAMFESLKEGFSKRGLKYEEIMAKNPIIELKGKYSDYFNSRSRNFRANYRKKTKRIKSWGSVLIEHEDSNNILLLLGKIKEIRKVSWQGEKDVNLSSKHKDREFLKEFLGIFLERGILDIAFIYLNKEPIAYLIGAKTNKTYFAIETAYKQKYFDVSPGMLLHLNVLERLYKEGGIDIMDLGYDAVYKRRWTELNRPEKEIIGYNKKNYPRVICTLRKSTFYPKLIALKDKIQ